MNPDVLKPKEENLFTLATELGLVALTENVTTDVKPRTEKKDAEKPKPYSQLT